MLIHPTFTSTVYDDEMLLVVQTVEEKDKWAKVARWGGPDEAARMIEASMKLADEHNVGPARAKATAERILASREADAE